jgi:outer membrane lipoprotein SlyB
MTFRKVALVAFISAASFLSACTSTIKATEYRASEVGEVIRAEPATVLSLRYVKIKGLSTGGARSSRRNGINYIIKIDRTGETLSVTQSSDVVIPAGSPAWVEFGDRIRIAPRN